MNNIHPVNLTLANMTTVTTDADIALVKAEISHLENTATIAVDIGKNEIISLLPYVNKVYLNLH